MKRQILVVAVAALAVSTMPAQEKKGGILHPEMKVETGTWDEIGRAHV